MLRFIRAAWSNIYVRLPLYAIAAVLIYLVFAWLSNHSGRETTDIINDVAENILLFAAIPSGFFWLAFVLSHTSWKRNPAGRSVVVLGLCLEALLMVNAASIFLGLYYPGREYIRIVAYTGLSAAIVYLGMVSIRLNVDDAVRRLSDRRQDSLPEDDRVL